MTKTMSAVVLTRFGSPEAFDWQEVDVPRVGTRQLRVRVCATSVNPLDFQTRRGDYSAYVSLPAIIGNDVSGIVEEVGTHVTEFEIGDAVYYTAKIFGSSGSYAEQHVEDVDLVARKPGNVSHREAASLPLVGGTVWDALVMRAQLRVGESILIHGGAGGVGSIAIQIARASGARVFTTARARDHAFLATLGAEACIDFTSEDYVQAINNLTSGRGVDVVLDTVGGDTLSRSPYALSAYGRVVSIVDISKPQNLLEAWSRNATYHFVFTSPSRAKLDALTRLVERGSVRPVIGAVLGLRQVGEAHSILENKPEDGFRGKVAIDVCHASDI